MPDQPLSGYEIVTSEIVDSFNKKMIEVSDELDDDVEDFIAQMMVAMSAFVGNVYGNLMMAAGLSEPEALRGFKTAVPIIKHTAEDIIRKLYAARGETRQ